MLLAILLFNWFGYRLLTSFLEEKANLQLEAQLDNNDYDRMQLIAIKVPVTHLAYYNYSASFERVDGQIEIDGIRYNYVKRRLLNDSLELLCIRNNAVMKLKAAKDDFFKSVNDLQQNGQNKKTDPSSHASKNFSPDYYVYNECLGLSIFCFNLPEKLFYLSSCITLAFKIPIDNPPEYRC